LINDNKLSGEIKKYPLKVNLIRGRNYKEVEVKTADELIEIIVEEYESNESVIFNKDGTTKRKKYSQILQELGVSGLQIMDLRTQNIIKEYFFYQKAPHQAPYDSRIWKESVIVLNNTLQTGMF